MTVPIVYDLLVRVEIEAMSLGDAVETLARNIAEFGVHEVIGTACEVIRDDNAHPPKDNNHATPTASPSSRRRKNLNSSPRSPWRWTRPHDTIVFQATSCSRN